MSELDKEPQIHKPCIRKDYSNIIVKYECAETIRMIAVHQIIADSFKIMTENAIKMKCPFYINIINKSLLENIKTEWKIRDITFQIEKHHVLIEDKECIKVNLSW
jgi:hypothetical protein